MSGNGKVNGTVSDPFERNGDDGEIKLDRSQMRAPPGPGAATPYTRSGRADGAAAIRHARQAYFPAGRRSWAAPGMPSGRGANRSQLAMNSAAMSGPITKPFRPNKAMPPRVEISTT